MSSCSNNKSGNVAQGPPGQNGQNAYLFVRYASDSLGSSFSLVPGPLLTYIAFLQSSNPAVPIQSDFTGLWKQYVGANGANGFNGTNGVNGTNGTDGGTYVLVSSPNMETIPNPGSLPNPMTFSSLSTADYAYQIGSRVRISKNDTAWMEGVVSNTTATDITVVIDLVQGAGETSQTWYFSIAGEPNTAPLGMINMWSGFVISAPGPTQNFDTTGLGVGGLKGWAMCNGLNTTPDLRGMFIAGLDMFNGAPDADYNAIGNTGGDKDITLTKAQIPTHVHTINTEPDHIHDLNAFISSDVPGTVGLGDNITAGAVSTEPAGAHDHGGNTGDGAADGLAGESHENRPPYYVLAYLMRIA